MELTFSDPAQRKQCENKRYAVRTLGPNSAVLLEALISDLYSAPTLIDLPPLYVFKDDVHDVKVKEAHLGGLLVVRFSSNHVNSVDGQSHWDDVTRIKIMAIESTDT